MTRRIVTFTVNDQLIPMLALWGHPFNPDTDEFKFDPGDEMDLKDFWVIILQALGVYEIPDEWVSKKFGFPIIRQENPATNNPCSGCRQQRFLRKFSVGSKSGQIILPKLYEPCPHCGGFHPEASGDIPDNMENEVIKIAGEIFNSGSKVTFSPGLLSRTVAQIQEN